MSSATIGYEVLLLLSSGEYEEVCVEASCDQNAKTLGAKKVLNNSANGIRVVGISAIPMKPTPECISKGGAK